MPVRGFLEKMDDDAAARLRDTLYTVVGFGVLGLQQAQVRRRELQKELAKLDEKVDPVLDDVEARLPEDLRPLVAPARSAAHMLLGPGGPRTGEPGKP